MSPVRPEKCAWCKKKLTHPAGAGRPRVYCNAECGEAHHNWRRRRERRIARGLPIDDQLDVFGELPLAASHGRAPLPRGPSDGGDRQPVVTGRRVRRMKFIDVDETGAAHV